MIEKDLNMVSGHIARGVLYTLVFGVTLWLVWGFLAPLILAAIVASLFIKVKPLAPSVLREKKSVFALLSVVTTVLLIVIPLLLLLVLIGFEAFAFGQFVQKMLSTEGFRLLLQSLHGFESQINEAFSAINVDFSFQDMLTYAANTAKDFGQLLYVNATGMMANLASLLINIFFFLFIEYFLVRDGEAIIEQIKLLLPFKKQDTQALVDSVEHVGQTVVLGSIVSSIILGGIMTAVFWIFGFTSPLLWGLAIMLLALIPLIGTWIIYIPSVIFLYFSHSWWLALLFLGTVLFIDSFLFYAVIRPRFLDAKTQLYPLAIFLAILGGLTTFGPIGIVYGPCIMALFITLMRHLIVMKASHEGK